MKRLFRMLFLKIVAAMALVSVMLISPAPALADGATQVSGIGYFAAPGDCTDPEGASADFALLLTGELDGCLYIVVESGGCTPSGVYRESGTETFVGQYGGEIGTFRTTYQFTAKYVDCANLVDEIHGRCQHPIVDRSGTGVFEGVTGRLDFKDDIEAGNFPYRGHLRW